MKHRQTTENILLLDHDSYAMRFQDMVALLDFWPRAHPYRVALLILASTGMRASELQNLNSSCFPPGGMIWTLRKNQKGSRSVTLTPAVEKEIREYIDTHKPSKYQFWPWKNEAALRDAVNKIARQTLGGNFLVKKVVPGCLKNNYVINLKSFRHTYQCVLFWQAFKKYGSGELAAAFVSRKMRHSGISFALTAKHYISSIGYLERDLQKLGEFYGNLIDALPMTGQTKIGQWLG